MTATQHEIRTVAGRLAAVRHRKTKAAFSARLDRDAKRIGCTPDVLLAAVREIAAERAEARRREADGWEARQAAEQREAMEFANAIERLLAAGWIRTHISVCGSQYFERDGQTLRLADHDIPVNMVRRMAAEDHAYRPRWTHEIFVGCRGWLRAIEELCLIRRGA